MTTSTMHPLADDYLSRLRRAARRLPRGRRDELIADIEAHLADAIAPDAGDAEALTVLDRLGTPEEIVEAEQPQPEAGADDPRGTKEWAAIFLLLFGGFAFFFGWVIGLIFLWGSRAWTTRDKWIGTLIVPGGLLTPLAFGAQKLISPGDSCSQVSGHPERCTGGASTLQTAIIAILVLAPIAVAIYLARRARRAPTV